MLASLRACKQQFAYGSLQHLKLRGESVHLHAGAAFATGLETTRLAYYAEGAPPNEAVARGVHALVTAYGDFDPGSSAKSLDRMVGALEYYFSEYPLDADPARVITLAGRPAVDFSFAIPLPLHHPDSGEPLVYAGRFDAVVDFAGGIYAMDEKTTSSLGSTWAKQWDLRGQFTGYAWALREHGLSPAGMIVSGVSILKTKYEQQRAIIPQPDWKVNAWLSDTLGEISDAIERHRAGTPPRKNWSEACNSYGACPYKQLCNVEDPQVWIDTYYECRPWNPLKVTEPL
jgi:hypothetical protein